MPPLTPDLAVLFETAQFTVSILAVEAIDVRAIVREATEDEVARPRFEMNRKGAGAGRVRITTSVEMALRLLCAWSEHAANLPATDPDAAELLNALRTAAAAVHAAYDRAKNPRRLSLGESAYIGQ